MTIKHWYQNPTKPIDNQRLKRASAHQNQLTKPQGSLGELERIAIRLAAMQAVDKPTANKPHITIFAGDHGIMQENVSAFPQEVTRQMLANFATGGACISVMARHFGASLSVIDCGCVGGHQDVAGVIDKTVAQGTNNFLIEPAMSMEQCLQAMQIGRESVLVARQQGADIYIAGEMGIGNTCSSSALACLLLDEPAERMTGRGTGVDNQALSHKTKVVSMAYDKYHHSCKDDALMALAAVGGFEMAAMTGAYVAAAQMGLPVVVDGFIASVSALTAVKMNAGVADWLLFGHKSAEQAHHLVLEQLQANPILDMGLRLGEGSGATASLAMIRLACDIHANMATFEQAGVAGA